MEFKFYGTKTEFTDAMKAAAKKKLSRLEKYMLSSENVSATVTVRVQKGVQTASVDLTVDGEEYLADASFSDYYTAVDACAEKLKSQLKKHKSKILSRKTDLAQPMVYEIRFTNNDGDIETFDVDVIADEPFEELQHRADREFADFCRSMHIDPSCEKDRKLIRS